MIRETEKEIVQNSESNNVAQIEIKKDSFLKRGADIVFSLVLMIVLLPVFIVIGVLIKLFGGRGKVFFKHERVGRGGKLFKMYKFRTMKSDKSIDEYLTSEQLELFHKEYKLEDDPRITKIGRFLRKTSLDELPQIINVLLGQMTFIGPRPVTEEETYFYGKDRAKLLSVKPGITGYWQVYGRNSITYESGERQKSELYYVDNRSLLLDLKIFFKTITAVFSGKDAY